MVGLSGDGFLVLFWLEVEGVEYLTTHVIELQMTHVTDRSRYSYYSDVHLFCIRDRPWPCFVTLRDPILRKRHKNVAEKGNFFMLFPSTHFGAKKEREKKEGSSCLTQFASLSKGCKESSPFFFNCLLLSTSKIMSLLLYIAIVLPSKSR